MEVAGPSPAPGGTTPPHAPRFFGAASSARHACGPFPRPWIDISAARVYYRSKDVMTNARESRMAAELHALRQRVEELERAAEALHEDKERYRAVFEQAADSIVLLDPLSGEILEFNDRTPHNLGYTREEFERLGLIDIEATESAEDIARHTEKIIREGSDTFETKHRRKDGELREILVSAVAVSVQRRQLIASIWRDITDRKRAEEALHKERDFSAKLLQASPTFFVGLSADGRTLMMNEAMLTSLMASA